MENELDLVILVNKDDKELGVMEKHEAHLKGVLHRAFSVLIFNNEGELLLQKRALNKYHSGGLWTNTCCSHPRPNETVNEAAKRRLKEEMGFSVELTPQFSFIYKTQLDNNMIEHEYDHVLYGYYSLPPHLNTDEVMDFRYVALDDLKVEMEQNPHHFTVWFKLLFENVLNRR